MTGLEVILLTLLIVLTMATIGICIAFWRSSRRFKLDLLDANAEFDMFEDDLQHVRKRKHMRRRSAKTRRISIRFCG